MVLPSICLGHRVIQFHKSQGFEIFINPIIRKPSKSTKIIKVAVRTASIAPIPFYQVSFGTIWNSLFVCIHGICFQKVQVTENLIFFLFSSLSLSPSFLSLFTNRHAHRHFLLLSSNIPKLAYRVLLNHCQKY